MMERWCGKVAIVTGASAGIGAAIAEALVEAGLQVVGLARRQANVEELADKLKRKPGKLFAIKADVTCEEDVDRAFKWIKKNLGPVHIVINNAGVVIPGRFIDSKSASWRDVLDTNLIAVCAITIRAIEDMKTNRVDGHIIQMSSVIGHSIPFGIVQNAYGVSKFGLTAFTETVRQELCLEGSKIKVSNISPGLVASEINDTTDEIFKKMASIESKDVADAILYMLGTPPHVQVHDLIIKPIGETF